MQYRRRLMARAVTAAGLPDAAAAVAAPPLLAAAPAAEAAGYEHDGSGITPGAMAAADDAPWCLSLEFY